MKEQLPCTVNSVIDKLGIKHHTIGSSGSTVTVNVGVAVAVGVIGDYAILYRGNHQSRLIELALQQQEQQESEEENQEEQAQPQPQDTEDMEISEEMARMILEALRNNEIQYIQQNKKKAKKPKDNSKPDW